MKEHKEAKGKSLFITFVIYLFISFAFYILSYIGYPKDFIYYISCTLYFCSIMIILSKIKGMIFLVKLHFMWRLFWAILTLVAIDGIRFDVIINPVIYILWLIYLFNSEKITKEFKGNLKDYFKSNNFSKKSC